VPPRAQSAFLKKICKYQKKGPSSTRLKIHSKRIEKSETEQKQFKEWVMQSKVFSEDEKRAVQYNTLVDFKKYWAQANEAKSDIEASHKKGRGLQSKRYQSFSTAVESFMEKFSPLIEIIKDFGAPYGGVALGTISLLFAVCLQFRDN
jgi:hypothetical protein